MSTAVNAQNLAEHGDFGHLIAEVGAVTETTMKKDDSGSFSGEMGAEDGGIVGKKK